MSSQLNNWAEAKNEDIFRCAVLKEFTFPAPILRKIPTGDWGGNGDKHKGRDHAEAKVILVMTEDVWEGKRESNPFTLAGPLHSHQRIKTVSTQVS